MNITHDDILLCPECGLDYLHHTTVDIYQREEDAEEGLHVSVGQGEHAKIDTNMDGNPSGRRHGLAIMFRCEDCTHISLLKVAQHKGRTFITFD